MPLNRIRLSDVHHQDLNIPHELLRRIDNLESRGIAKSKDQSIEDLRKERERLYEKRAQIIIDCNDKKHEQIAAEIVNVQTVR
jgi:shikimate kinase